jgi:hypothetical protein
MAVIVAVHGIGQQFKGDAKIHAEWWPALLSGLHLAGKNLASPAQLECAFYGNHFRKSGSLDLGAKFTPNDVGPDEGELLGMMWHVAAMVEPQIVPPQSSGSDNLARTPHFIQCALNALSRSAFLTNILQSTLIGDLKQVFLYLNNPDIRKKVLETVTNKIAPDTRVVIGHSLGSIVAYEALCQKPANVKTFLSIGSPLGIQNLIFQKLTPHPDPRGKWAGRVQHWINIADEGDIVALEKSLAPFFGPQVIRDVLVYNGSDAHHGERYLTTREAGEAIATGLP